MQIQVSVKIVFWIFGREKKKDDNFHSFFFPGERLQASNEDLALAVNAAAVDSRNDDDDEDWPEKWLYRMREER